MTIAVLTIEECKQMILDDLSICKEYLGEQVVYSLSAFKKIIKKLHNLSISVRKSSKTTIKREFYSRDISNSQEFEVPGTIDTKLFKDISNLTSSLQTVCEVMGINHMKVIKGFVLTDGEIDKGAEIISKEVNDSINKQCKK